MSIADLLPHERLVLGGLIRLLVRLDGEFTEAEEDRMNHLGDAIGGRTLFWRVISDSAQAMPDESEVRAAAERVERPAARALILDTLTKIAEADHVERREQEMLDWLHAAFAR